MKFDTGCTNDVHKINKLCKRYYPKEEEMVEPFFEDDKFGWLAFNIIDKFEIIYI